MSEDSNRSPEDRRRRNGWLQKIIILALITSVLIPIVCYMVLLREVNNLNRAVESLEGQMEQIASLLEAQQAQPDVDATQQITVDGMAEQEGRILYATSTLLNSVMSLDTTKSREILNKFPIKKTVPQARFYTAIDLLDGKTPGEELGHYQKSETGKEINFMILHKPAVIKFDKHVANNVIPAAQNTNADADIVKYRKYGLVDAYQNKRAGIYLQSK